MNPTNQNEEQKSDERRRSFLTQLESMISTQQPEISETTRNLLIQDINEELENLSLNDVNMTSNNPLTNSQLQENYSTTWMNSKPLPRSIKDLEIGLCSVPVKARISYVSPKVDDIFLMDLLDQESQEARIFFEGPFCDKFKGLVQPGGLYIITGLIVMNPYKNSRRMYTCFATKTTSIVSCPDDQSIALFPPTILTQISQINPSSDKAFDIVPQSQTKIS